MACGYEIGPALLGPVIGYILSLYGWRTSMLTIGMLSTLSYLCCFVFIPPTRPSSEEIDSQVDETRTYNDPKSETALLLSPQEKNNMQRGILDNKSINCQNQTHLWKTPLFLALCLSQMFFNMFYQALYVYTPLKADTLTIPSSQTAWLLPILGVSAIVIRFTLSKVLDNHPGALLYSAVLCLCSAGILSWFTPLMTSFSTLAVYCLVAGGCAGSYYIIL